MAVRLAWICLNGHENEKYVQRTSKTHMKAVWEMWKIQGEAWWFGK